MNRFITLSVFATKTLPVFRFTKVTKLLRVLCKYSQKYCAKKYRHCRYHLMRHLQYVAYIAISYLLGIILDFFNVLSQLYLFLLVGRV